MRRRTLEVELGGFGSLVRGHGAREFVEAATGRPPVWIPRLRGFSCQQTTASDVIAQAERQGYDVSVTGAREARKARLFDMLTAAPAQPEQPDPGRGLW